MGYKISYGNVGSIRHLKNRRSYGGVVYGVLVLLLLAASCSIWAEVRRLVLYTILPGDPVVTAAAISQLSYDLQSGSTVFLALNDFFADVLEGAGFDTGR